VAFVVFFVVSSSMKIMIFSQHEDHDLGNAECGSGSESDVGFLGETSLKCFEEPLLDLSWPIVVTSMNSIEGYLAVVSSKEEDWLLGPVRFLGADEEGQQFQNAGSSGVAVVDDAKAESVEKSHLESEAEEKMHLEMEVSEVATACIEAETAEKDRLGTEAADLAHAKAVSIEKSHWGSEAKVKMHLATNTRDILGPAQTIHSN